MELWAIYAACTFQNLQLHVGNSYTLSFHIWLTSEPLLFSIADFCLGELRVPPTNVIHERKCQTMNIIIILLMHV